MGLYGTSRNFGMGKQMGFAGSQALASYYGGGHHGSQAAHSDRFGRFADWAKDEGICDLREVDQEVVEAYGEDLRGAVDAGDISVSYAQNLVSTVNVVMEVLRGDTGAWVSPSGAVGERDNIRRDVPGGIGRDQVQAATSSMRAAGLDRAAAVVGLAREFGLRQREATLANLGKWQADAARCGYVNVVDGTKGGRGHEVDRWVKVTPEGAEALARAVAASPEGSRNLLAPSEKYIGFVRGEISAGRAHLKDAGIGKYHDLRAAYACDRYQQLTGQAAPCATGGLRLADGKADMGAREVITQELGHGRVDVLVAYVGARRG